MTDATAQEVADILIESFRQYNFNCIGTFSLSESDRNEFDEIKEDYRYIDTDTEFNYLASRARMPGEAVAGLTNFVSSVRQYFQAAVSLPGKIDRTFLQYTSERIPLQLNTMEERSIDIRESLNSPQLKQLMLLLDIIDEHIEKPDDDFFQALDQLNE